MCSKNYFDSRILKTMLQNFSMTLLNSDFSLDNDQMQQNLYELLFAILSWEASQNVDLGPSSFFMLFTFFLRFI